mmetsp:Transcript_12981/g.19615  ORF Transcript_12981/g.19615 Transcript_12981/m.19615 type:complete len:267 (+) Transcript_12981:249-1049(+)
MFILVSLFLAFFHQEYQPSNKTNNLLESIRSVYTIMFDIIQLPNMRYLIALLLIHKIPFTANDSVSALKLLEKGFKKEWMALFALVDFPFQILSALAVGHWSTRKDTKILEPWVFGFATRLFMCVVSTLLVYWMPDATNGDEISWSYIIATLCISLCSSFASTMMFVSMGALFASISDSRVGGTYLTLLNTLSNFGGLWPKYFVNYAVDYLTTDVWGDGYYYVSWFCVLIGIVSFFLYIRRAIQMLNGQAKNSSSWTVNFKKNNLK